MNHADLMGDADPRNPRSEAVYSLRKGIAAIPRSGDQTTAYWIDLANTGTQTQRISAFIVLLETGVGIEVSLIEES